MNQVTTQAEHGIPVIDGLQINNWDREVVEEVQAGGISCVHATCAVWEGARDTLREIGRWRRRFRNEADLVVPAYTSRDILAAKQEGKIAVVLGFQNTAPIEDDLSLIDVFHRLGVRIIQLTYNIQNSAGGSCYDPVDSGLTRFGRLVVAQMNRCGVLIDLSHVGERTSLEAVEASTKPVAITHANPLWFHDAPRNKSDDVLRAVAQAGGVIGCTMYPLCIGGAERSLDDFCAMVEELVADVGIEHVALGSDSARKWPDAQLAWLRNGSWRFPDGDSPSWPAWPAWFSGPHDFGRVLEALRGRGFRSEEVEAIAGGNWLRLFAEIFDEGASPGT